MFDTIFNAFALFATLDNALALFVGVIFGVVVGAIPGMTTPMGVALALPFTFTMQPVTGILLLLGVYKGGLYGGSITAILIIFELTNNYTIILPVMIACSGKPSADWNTTK